MRIWTKKTFPKCRVFTTIFRRKLDQKVFRATWRSFEHFGDTEDHQEIYTQGNFPDYESRNKLSQVAKTNGRNCSESKDYLGQTRYNRAYPEKHSTASPVNPKGVTKPSSHLLFFHNRMKSLWKSRQVLQKPIFWQFLVINQREKIARSQNLHQNPLSHTLLSLFLSSSDIYYIEVRWTR